MSVRQLALDLAIGAAAGFVATKATDRAQGILWRLTPAAARAREPQSADGSTSQAAARKVCEQVGAAPDQRRLRWLRGVLHYGLGAGWGSGYGLLRRYGHLRPLGAGVATGTSLSVLIDEGLCPALRITAPYRAYPQSAHVRGLLTHLVYGLTVAAVAESAHRLAREVEARRAPRRGWRRGRRRGGRRLSDYRIGKHLQRESTFSYRHLAGRGLI